MDPEVILGAALALATSGVDYVKIALFPDPRREDCIRALASAAMRTKIIGVLFADLGADAALAPAMKQAGFAGAMIDTAGKRDKRLLDFHDPTRCADSSTPFIPRGSSPASRVRSSRQTFLDCFRFRRIFSVFAARSAEKTDGLEASARRPRGWFAN